ncbi:MAG: tRNA uridine-5-carboxymethylaminomethyl(34) synthesis GTPase MnmE [Erysipelotrichia bacterium]|nr:tRNA uridine-5-carboxymethylaminomethyl(34) synthesis GTPase MnmE [Erysipelotrichia bacterium]NCC54296.1 tRNA uridine-5-carboxymethylaminomethyl(34) synthesis GTPase MnmE [Erysipelotrichia bacterium]
MLYDTIVAISTPLSEGAISIIRMSGKDAIAIANQLCSIDLLKKEGNTISYTYIIDPKKNKAVDEVLVSIFKGRKSFTGEDVVEINAHGGIFITKQILTLCLENGARLARAGEFTQRAFLNGKLDLTQAEAINDMINAHDENATQLAMSGIKGSVAKLIHPFIEHLLDIIANIEVNIDYPEYDDVEQLTSEKLLPMCQNWLQDIDEILNKARSGKIMREGIKTTIVGKPNVGKSSLLNALLDEDKAIVTDIEGTTRDIVEGMVRLDYITLHLIDTAGIRESDDVVEKIGIEKSKQAIEDADLVILLLDGSKPLETKDEQLLALTKHKTRLIVYNKEDVALEKKDEQIWISAAKHEIQALIDAINQMYEEHKIALQQPTLNNERQISLMNQSKQHMMQAIDAMEMGMELDLVAIDLQNAYTCMKEILGEVNRDDLLDTLFSNFCLGK